MSGNHESNPPADLVYVSEASSVPLDTMTASSNPNAVISQAQPQKSRADGPELQSTPVYVPTASTIPYNSMTASKAKAVMNKDLTVSAEIQTSTMCTSMSNNVSGVSSNPMAISAVLSEISVQATQENSMSSANLENTFLETS